jgi:hypothetical protein
MVRTPVPSAINRAAEQYDAACNDRRSPAFARQAPETGTSTATNHVACAAVWFDANATDADSRGSTGQCVRHNGATKLFSCSAVRGAKSRARAIQRAARDCSRRRADSSGRYINDRCAAIEQRAIIHRSTIARATACCDVRGPARVCRAGF